MLKFTFTESAVAQSVSVGVAGKEEAPKLMPDKEKLLIEPSKTGRLIVFEISFSTSAAKSFVTKCHSQTEFPTPPASKTMPRAIPARRRKIITAAVLERLPSW